MGIEVGMTTFHLYSVDIIGRPSKLENNTSKEYYKHVTNIQKSSQTVAHTSPLIVLQYNKAKRKDAYDIYMQKLST